MSTALPGIGGLLFRMARRRRRRGEGPAEATPNDEDVVAVLVGVAEMMSQSYRRDLFRLQVSVAEYRALAEQLQRYRGSAIVQDWYANFLLASVRRLVDTGDNVVSMRRALHQLRAVAHLATPDLIGECRRRLGVTDEAGTDGAVIDSLAQLFPERSDEAPLGQPAVQADVTLIRDVADRAHAIATHAVAHTLDLERPAAVTYGEYDELLAQLFAIYNRWSIVLRATETYDTSADQRLTNAVVRALELFDWEAYIAAVSAEVERRGYRSSFEDVQATLRVRYEFEEDPASRAYRPRA